MHRDTSEVSIRNTFLLFRDGVPLGGLVALEGRNLIRARKADALALMKDLEGGTRDAVLGRLKACGHLFVYPGVDEYYLAKMGVVQEARGTGAAKKIFGMSIEAGAALGYKKFRGDVHVDNVPALRLYQAFGFETVAEHSCAASGLSYVSVFLDRSR
jgi:ribosomal protein S18 acetylase RimI-like enzyme